MRGPVSFRPQAETCCPPPASHQDSTFTSLVWISSNQSFMAAIQKRLGAATMSDVEDDDTNFQIGYLGSRKKPRLAAGRGEGRVDPTRSPYFPLPSSAVTASNSSLGRASRMQKTQGSTMKTTTLRPRRRRVSDSVTASVVDARGDTGEAAGQPSLVAFMKSCLQVDPGGVPQPGLTGTFSSRLREGHQQASQDVVVDLDGKGPTSAGTGGAVPESRKWDTFCETQKSWKSAETGALGDITVNSNIKASTAKVRAKTVSRKRKLTKSCLPEQGLDVLDSAGMEEAAAVQPAKNCEIMMDALDRLRASAAALGTDIVHIEHLPARMADFGEMEYKPHTKLQKALRDIGILRLYSHQAAAVNKVFSGSSIVAATPTASGKSMTYLIPVLDSLISVAKSRALFLFPLKALAQDQLKTLCDLVTKVKKGQPHCYCYDGDTSHADRNKIRKNGRIILTNPDMLHHNILPNHQYWAQFFTNLKFVVLDEAHIYRGVFGSHVGCILRRLLRIARHYGAEPMFICCSATIGNPKEHVKQLTTLEVEEIHGTGAPVGDRHILCWKPPDRSPYSDSADVAIELLKCGLQILIFVEARKLAEIVSHAIRQKLIAEKLPDLANKVESYRAGYTAEDRRALEKRLQSGSLKALVCTRALELGIDVGYLDATIHVGLPDTMCSLWQQVGRSGRRQGASLAVIVAHQRPNDLFYMKNPQKLFAREMEKAYCNPCNPQLLKMHLCCAADELPLEGKDCEYFGEEYEECRDDLAMDGILRSGLNSRGETTYKYRLTDKPCSKCPIRGTSSDSFQLVNQQNQVIEEMDRKWAYRRLHTGAIYHHQRECYEIVNLDITRKKAVGVPREVDYVTEVKDRLTVEILVDNPDHKKVGATHVHFGKVRVKEEITEYSMVDLIRDRIVNTCPLDLPPSVFDTVGFWCDIPQDVIQKFTGHAGMMREALSALALVMRALLPALTMSEQSDMNSLATLQHEGTKQAQIFMYDAYPGGIGLARQAYEEYLEELWSRALSVINSCDCKNGCPCCIKSGSSDDTEVLPSNTKQACKTLLEGLLGSWMSSNPGEYKQSSQFSVSSEGKKSQKSMTAILLERFEEPL